MEPVLEEEKERSCAYSGCKRTFEGRKDKIYCSDQCRNAAGREKNKISKWKEPEHFGQINRIILRNYQILKGLYNETLTPLKNWQLSDEGFEFKFMTGIYRVDEGIEIFMCYEYGWHQLSDNKVRIYHIPPLFLTGMASSIVK
ncbi:hypothetical protein FFJ24_021240 [Pedobacter sp. KBS0701]|uniref:hypothetical protein n=1 Tax=Pedobacter sp. KBS0701 TaxID=2578106 RepID=UPI00110EA48E|nr:hypothetical protein [Pedobacter sp. KBS0701]QDW27213.1 hypothetical protein FFJ24_021240 [Pedobacter sp. KBS0701]